MSRREDFDTAAWADFELLSAFATLLYIWSWTNTRNGMAGVYRTTRAQMTESRVPLDEIDGALRELEQHRFAFYIDGWMFVRARVKRIASKSPSMAKAIAKDVAKVPADHPVRRMWLEQNLDLTWPKDGLRAALIDARVVPWDGTLPTPSREGGGDPPDTLSGGSQDPSVHAGSAHPPGTLPRGSVVGAGAGSTSGDRGDLEIDAGARDARPRPLHPDLDEVLEIFAGVPVLAVNDAAVESALRAGERRGVDVVAAAHTVASWAHTGELHVRDASRLLHTAIDRFAANETKAKAQSVRTAFERGPSGQRRPAAPSDLVARGDLALAKLMSDRGGG